MKSDVRGLDIGLKGADTPQERGLESGVTGLDMGLKGQITHERGLESDVTWLDMGLKGADNPTRERLGE